MAGPGSNWSGPLMSGTKKDTDQNGPANTGLALLTQTLTLNENGANTVNGTFTLPYGSQIVDFNIDTTTTWNSGTSDTLSIGTSSGGTQYAGSVAVGTGIASARQNPSYTAAELAAMENIGSNTSVVVTVTPSGTAATAGSTTVTIMYIQTVQLGAGEA
jgi:hypothetical protein